VIDLEEIRKKIAILWDGGYSINEICRALPCREGTTKRIIKGMKESGELEERAGKKEFTTEKVLALYHSGVTNPYEIANSYGISVGTVKRVLVEAKLSRKRPEHNYKTTKPRAEGTLCENTRGIISDLRSGLTPRQVAKKRDMSTQWVYVVKTKYIDKGDKNEQR
jgi:transposase